MADIIKNVEQLLENQKEKGYMMPRKASVFMDHIRELIINNIGSIPTNVFENVDDSTHFPRIGEGKPVNKFLDIWAPAIKSFIEAGEFNNLLRLGMFPGYQLSPRGPSILDVAIEKYALKKRESVNSSKYLDQLTNIINKLVSINRMPETKGEMDEILENGLTTAAQLGDSESAKTLLANGVNPNNPSRNPLIAAVSSAFETGEYSPVIQVLLDDPRTDLSGKGHMDDITEDNAKEFATNILEDLNRGTEPLHFDFFAEMDPDTRKKFINIFKKIVGLMGGSRKIFKEKVLPSAKRITSKGFLKKRDLAISELKERQKALPPYSMERKYMEKYSETPQSKWQTICQYLQQEFGLSELKDIAQKYNISNIGSKSKRQLCKDLAESPAVIYDEIKRLIGDKDFNERYEKELEELPNIPQDVNELLTLLVILYERDDRVDRLIPAWVRSLGAKGADPMYNPNRYINYSSFRSPLWQNVIMISHGDPTDIVKAFIDIGAPIDIPLHAHRTPLILAIVHGDPNTISLLLNTGKSLPEYIDENGYDALAHVVQDRATILPILLANPQVLSLVNQDREGLQGTNTLQWAASVNNVNAMKLLLKAAKFSPKQLDESLYRASNFGNLEAVKLLLDAGANPNYVDDEGYTVLEKVGKFRLISHPSDEDIAEINRLLIEFRHKIIGKPGEMRQSAAEIIEQPGGLKEKSRRATNPHFKTDVGSRAGLCKLLEDEMYRDELYALANELRLPVTKKTTKKELCKMIAEYGEIS